MSGQRNEDGAQAAPSTPADLPRPADDDGWRAVIDAMSDPAIALDVAGVVIHHNPLVVDLFPRVRAGQPITHLSRNPELLDAVDRARTTDDRIVIQLEDRVPVERRISAIITRLALAGELAGAPALLIVFRDISDQERLARMRADFIANASHELRTPLASLRGFVETLQGPAREDPGSRDRFLAIMATQAARMTQLIDDLLSLSRVEMRMHVPPRGIVDLNELAGFVVQMLEPLAQAANASLEVDRLGGPAEVRGDRDELVQVFQNLVHNAIKYGRPGGHVRVQVAREPEQAGYPSRIAVAVVDEGPGIAPVHLPRLTERFYRVNVAQSREKGGTGLGLAIAKNIVHRHRGELKIASKIGEGSTFTVVLDELRSTRP